MRFEKTTKKEPPQMKVLGIKASLEGEDMNA